MRRHKNTLPKFYKRLNEFSYVRRVKKHFSNHLYSDVWRKTTHYKADTYSSNIGGNMPSHF